MMASDRGDKLAKSTEIRIVLKSMAIGAVVKEVAGIVAYVVRHDVDRWSVDSHDWARGDTLENVVSELMRP